jgi:hypothetical protein
MDKRLEEIIRGRIKSERASREIPTMEALQSVHRPFAQRNALGNARMPVLLDVEAAKELEFRADTWLRVVHDAFQVASVAWTSRTSGQVRHLVATELIADFEELLQHLRVLAKPHTPVMEALDKAKNRAAATVAHKTELLVYAADRGRIPVLEQLNAPRYAAIRTALTKARQLLESQPPDLPNGVKEAIGAVEQLARLVTNQPKATLGDCIKALRSAGRIEPPLLKGIEEIWGWASEKAGVRHGADQSAEPASARYVVSVAEASVGLLLTLDAA